MGLLIVIALVLAPSSIGSGGRYPPQLTYLTSPLPIGTTPPPGGLIPVNPGFAFRDFGPRAGGIHAQ